jgi:glycosyltransferase involved in cell wall biosynthesis
MLVIMPISTKVLHVVNISFTLPYFIGDQFEHFQKRGMDFYVACYPSSHFSEYALRKGFVPVPTNILREINLFADIRAVWHLIKLIRKENIDIVIGHTPKGAMIGILAAYLAKVDKRVYFRHGIMYETAFGLKRFVLKNIEKLTGLLATKVVCVSKSVIKVSEKERLNNPKKNILLGNGSCNGVDAAMKFNPENISDESLNKLKYFYGIKPEDRVIGYVGRFVEDKGINELIDAWKILKMKHQNIKLLLVGPLESRDGISKTVNNDIINTPSIIYTGPIEEVPPFYALMDIFILPSRREGLPTVVMEASSMELPVITTKATGCIDSIRDKETGLFTDLTASDIASKIEILLANPQLARKYGQEGRKFMLKDYSPNLVWKDIEEKVFEIAFDQPYYMSTEEKKFHKAS